MLLYLFLTILCGLIVLAAVVLFIVGIVKKRKKLWMGGIWLFVGSFLGLLLSAIIYTSKTMDYVQSGKFQEDTRRGSALIGKTIGAASSGISEGLANTLDEEAIAKLAQKSGAIMGKSVKTIASGLDSTLGSKKVFLDQTLNKENLTLGRAEESLNDSTGSLNIFIEAEKDFSGKLTMTNYDQTGKKIAVAEKTVTLKAGKGQVESFIFKHASFGVTTYFILSK